MRGNFRVVSIGIPRAGPRRAPQRGGRLTGYSVTETATFSPKSCHEFRT